MKKNNTPFIVATIAIIIFIAAGSYLLGRGNARPQSSVSASARSGRANSANSYEDLVGKPAPAFSLRDRNGVEYSSENLKGKNVVLFFNEGLMCYPACWNQMVALATDSRFSDPDTAAFSVVVDRAANWDSAIRKMPELGKATVLFDSDKSVSRAFGMLTLPSSMHYGSFPGHSFVLIDKQGIVRFTLDDPTMAIDNDQIVTELAKLN